MTPADLARESAITFEAKKDSLRQTQDGTWKIAFTVQGIDMDDRLTKAFPGTRYVAVLVQIGDDELPIQQPAKENKVTPIRTPAMASPVTASEKPKRDWRDVQPAAQAGIRCNEPTFIAFLNETRRYRITGSDEAAEAVREICGVKSRVELGTRHAARALWHQLDTEYSAWLALEHA